MKDHWPTMRHIQRTIDRWQSKAFVTEVLMQVETDSVYALEELMMAGVDDLHFPDDRPKLCDRMISLGEPAIAKYLGLRPARDLRTKLWIDRLTRLAPTALLTVKSRIWRLLDPTPLTFMEWEVLNFEYGFEIQKAVISNNVWCVSIEPESLQPEPKREYFVCEEEEPISLLALGRHLLALRRYETWRDFIGYRLELLESLRLAKCSNAEPDLAALQPLIVDYLAYCYGTVDVAAAMQAAWEVEASQRAWSARVSLFER